MKKLFSSKKSESFLFYLSIILPFLLIKLSALFFPREIRWDEAVYMSMGKYLFSFGEIGFWEPLRPILLPIINGFIWFLSLNQVLVGEIIMILFSTGSLIVFYKLLSEFYDKKFSLFSTAIFAITPIFFYHGFYVFTEIPSLFFGLLSLYCFIKSRFFIAGIFSSLAFLTRFPQGIFFACIFLFLFWEIYKKKAKFSHLSNLILGFALPLLFFLTFNGLFYTNLSIQDRFFYPFSEASKYQYSPLDNIKDPLLNIAYYFYEIPKDNLILLLSFVSIFFILKEKNHQKKLAFVFLLFLILWFSYHLSINNKQLRFAIAVVPMLSYFSTTFLFLLFNKINKYQRFVLIALISLLAISIIIKDINFIFWREKIPENVVRYYSYFSNKEGYIAISDPVAGVFMDKKLEIIYDNPYVFYDSINKKDFDYILHSSHSLYCESYDEACIQKIVEINTKLNSDFSIIYETTNGKNIMRIYEKKK
ncbi:MAG: glycosyltransferase family 39 protein [Candidatus Pacearchaeota archaeon]